MAIFFLYLAGLIITIGIRVYELLDDDYQEIRSIMISRGHTEVDLVTADVIFTVLWPIDLCLYIWCRLYYPYGE